MLRLYVFAVCDKVIVDSSGTASLISLFNQVSVQVPQDAEPVPPDAVAPKEWAIFTSWEQEAEDAGRQYREVIQVLNPDGSLYKETPITFTGMAGKTHQQITANVLGFPIGRQGTYKVQM